MNGRTLASLGLTAGVKVRVAGAQGAVELETVQDDAVADRAVRISAAFENTAAVGGAFGQLSVERIAGPDGLDGPLDPHQDCDHRRADHSVRRVPDVLGTQDDRRHARARGPEPRGFQGVAATVCRRVQAVDEGSRRPQPGQQGAVRRGPRGHADARAGRLGRRALRS
ncbi:hypothetical protein G6F65_019373 [Rhizopus arrhizus]|nr:hypothetical protein G6F65_019373 [Rhizopus arrhizus]